MQLDVLDDGVGQQRLGDLPELGLVGLAVDLEDEVLALADAAHAGVAEAPEGAEHRLPLGIGDLWLQDDVDDHLGHADEGTGPAMGADTTPVGGCPPTGAHPNGSPTCTVVLDNRPRLPMMGPDTVATGRSARWTEEHGMVAGVPNVDHPAAATALSVLPLGQDEALTARVRREGETYLYLSAPRNALGEATRFVEQDMLELSWQADDGLRSVPADAVAVTDDGLWKVKITGPASKIQRRDAVRAPIGLSVTLSWDRATLVGSTVDLSEGGLLAVFRPHGDLGVGVPFPTRNQSLALSLDLYSDELVTEVALVRRRPRQDNLHEWSLRFVDLPDPAADLIRSHVFTALRNARARGITAIY